MSYFNEFLALGLVGFLGVLSPGPDFVIVTQNSLQQGRKAGLLTALGIALGCLIHVTYCVIGIAVIVAESIVAFTLIKFLGAAYLIYIGCKGVMAKPVTAANYQTVTTSSAKSDWANLKTGFLVNVLNPKATLFFLSVFTQIIDPQTPRFIQALYGLEMTTIALLWFSILACLLAHPQLKIKLISVQHYVERILGGVLILLGLKVATMSFE